MLVFQMNGITYEWPTIVTIIQIKRHRPKDSKQIKNQSTQYIQMMVDEFPQLNKSLTNSNLNSIVSYQI